MKIRRLILTLLITLLTMGGPVSASDASRVEPAPANSETIPTVSLCQLAANPQSYDNKTIRLRASYLFDVQPTDDPFYHLYDLSCSPKENRIAPNFKCVGDEGCKKFNKLLKTHARYNEGRTMGRVELTVVGQFHAPNGKGYGHLGMHPLGMDITQVERVRPIAPKTPWP
ncbi:MAG TPA: hypothetical protein VF791_16380 [Pyrinomonadaceae bacterium]